MKALLLCAIATVLATSIILNTTVYAQDHVVIVNNFDLGLSSHPITVSDKMLVNGRKAAIKNADALFRQASDPVIGNPNGAITFVAFLDYQCPISEKMDPSIQALIQANPDLRIVYKELPLRGEKSVYAAKAALAANQQGKYLALHTALMRAGAAITDKKVLAIATEQGLDMQKLKADMQSELVKKQINAIRSLAHDIGVLGTPTLFFSKTNIAPDATSDAVLFMMGKFTQQELQQAINYIKQ
jgi:protein-disulfide isomerase